MISVVGLGKLGSCMAVVLALRGIKVLGMDIDKYSVDVVNTRVAIFNEPGLQSRMTQCPEGNLIATNDYERVINETNITLIIVPTPSDLNGRFSTKYLRDALISLSKALKRHSKKHHLFVITSTVMPGDAQKVLIPTIENFSKRSVNKGFSVCYSPEFVALGSVICDLSVPDVVLIGESNKKAGDVLEKVYRQMCVNNPEFVRTNIQTAEITKICFNAFLTTKVSFANMVANVCENIPGARVDDITETLGSDSRISPKYLKGGLGFGGPCLPRDTVAFRRFLQDNQVGTGFIEAVESINKKQISKLVGYVTSLWGLKDKKISILGLSYKPCTSVLDDSPSIELIKALVEQSENLEVFVYDPCVEDIFEEDLFPSEVDHGCKLYNTKTIGECVLSSNVVVLMHPDTMGIYDLSLKCDLSGTIIIDCWRVLDVDRVRNCDCFRLGEY